MAEKIFIELDEEIIFIVEKIKKVEGKKIILIVPDRAALLGSIVSLKLLASEIAKTGKLAALVTTDEVGFRLAGKAGLVACEKVGDIKKEMWEKAHALQKETIDKQKAQKEALIQERKEEDGNFKEEAEPKEKKELNKLKRLEPQKIDLAGFEMVSGGDIAEFDGSVDADTASALEKEVLETQKEEAPFENISSASRERSDDTEFKSHKEGKKEDVQRGSRKERSLLGRDLSSFNYVSVPKKGKPQVRAGKGLNIGENFQKLVDSIKYFFAKGGSQKRLFLIGVAVVIVFFLLSYFVFPEGKVTIKVESRDIELQKEVIADTSTTILDTEALTIPAQLLEVVKDRSGSADATGTKETGEFARGQVTIFNVTASAVSVPSGTILESVETGLKYKTTTEVSVDARKSEEEGGGLGVADVGVVADNFGENYNVSTKQEFRIQGFDVEKLYAKNFNNITGGTTEQKKVVSQSDYDNLKTSLEEQLKQDVLAGLEGEAGDSKELLTDTVQYEVINEDPTPGVSEEAQTFNLSLSLKATALSFNKGDVDKLAQVLVEEDTDVSVEVEEFEYSSQVLKTEGDKIYINLHITGVVTPTINQEDVKSNLKGKPREAAESFLDSQEEIKQYEIELSPRWMPSFLKHFPSSVGRIEVKIEKV